MVLQFIDVSQRLLKLTQGGGASISDRERQSGTLSNDKERPSGGATGLKKSSEYWSVPSHGRSKRGQKLGVWSGLPLEGRKFNR